MEGIQDGIAVRWHWRREEREDDTLRLDIRVHLSYRVGALAELMAIVTARRAFILNFSAQGAKNEFAFVARQKRLRIGTEGYRAELL